MCLHMYKRMLLQMFVGMYLYLCMCVCTCIYVNVNSLSTCKCLCICMQKFVHANVYANSFVHGYICLSMFGCIHQQVSWVSELEAGSEDAFWVVHRWVLVDPHTSCTHSCALSSIPQRIMGKTIK